MGRPASGTAAAWSNVRFAGFLTTRLSGTGKRSAKVPKPRRKEVPKTSSLRSSDVTSFPTASTVAATSQPGVRNLGCPVRTGTRVRGRGPGQAAASVSVRDATSAGRQVRVRWRKRRWSCLEPVCDRSSWTEQHDAVGARRRTTRRCRQQVAAAVTRGRAVAEAAEEVGLGWRAAMRAVAEEAKAPDRFRPVVRLGVDETVSRRRRRLVTHLVDLDTWSGAGSGSPGTRERSRAG